MSEEGNYCLAIIIKMEEKYDSLRMALSTLVAEMRALQYLEINGKPIPTVLSWR